MDIFWNNGMRLSWTMITALFFTGSVHGAIKTLEEISFYSTFGQTDLNGYLQIPSGGAFGTSLSKEPNLNDLGMNHATFFDAGINSRWEAYSIYANYQYVRPKGVHTLNNNLLTHGTLFLANTVIQSHAKFDLYELGLQRRFCIHNFVFYPEIELSLLGFNYQLDALYEQTGRKFCQTTARLGVGGEYFFNRCFSICFNGVTSIPGLTRLSISTLQTDLKFNLFSTSRIKTSFFVGLSYQQINFKDKQPFPNHIHVVEWPIGYLGVKLTLL